MRWAHLLPLAASLPWVLLTAIIADQFRDFAADQTVTLGAKVWAVTAPVIAFCALISVSGAFARRLKGSGWALTGVCVLALLGFASHLVWFTGGV